MTNQENREMLERITKEEGIVAEIVSKFSFDQMYDQRYFVSLLFYLRLLTISGSKYGMTELGIPNFVIRTIYWEQLKYQLEKGYMLKYDTVELQKAIWEMAHDGKVC